MPSPGVGSLTKVRPYGESTLTLDQGGRLEVADPRVGRLSGIPSVFSVFSVV